MGNAFYKWQNGPVDVPSTMSAIGEPLPLPKGRYVITAKLYLAQGSGDSTKVEPNQVTARLETYTGDKLGDFDACVTTVPIADAAPFRSGAAAISLLVVTNLTAPGHATLKLDKKPDTTPYLQWAWFKIAAIQVDAINP
jgi:hypothetical protein